MTTAAPGPDRGFVLHAYPYRETSLLLQLWTRGHGRFAAVAKGAKRAKGAAKAMLLPFVPLDLSWFGRGELKTLKLAEPNGLALPLSGGALMAGFYVNELLLKLIQRDDPHEALWDAYADAIESLRSLSLRSLGVPGLVAAEPALGEPRAVEPVLRKFELAMLRELGYAAELGRDMASGEGIDPERDYWYVAERGPIAWDGRPERGDAVKLRGLTLMHLERGEFDDPLTASQAKSLMRMLINRCLNGQELATRALVRDLQRLEGAA